MTPCGTPSVDMPTGRAFWHPLCQKKNPPRAYDPPSNVGKCEALTLNEKWQPGGVKLKNANPQSQATRR